MNKDNLWNFYKVSQNAEVFPAIGKLMLTHVRFALQRENSTLIGKIRALIMKTRHLPGSAFLNLPFGQNFIEAVSWTFNVVRLKLLFYKKKKERFILGLQFQPASELVAISLISSRHSN